MQVKTIAGHDLMPGKTVKDHIHVEGTELHVPHVLLCGDQPGPTVLISAGIHNAEYVGIQAAIELSNELDVSALHGNVIIVPLANRSGFENRTMSMVYEDGKNLNRVFPGDRDRANSAEQGVWDQNVEAEGENFDVMEDIARRVPLSKIPRPAWDLKQLTAHGLQAEADEEVWQRVWSEEEKISFASTPMFLVRGRK